MPSTFGAQQAFGNLAGWNEQNADQNTGKDRAQTLGKTGNETASAVFNEKTDVSVPYKAASAGTVAIPGTIGAVLNGVLLTQIQINTKAEDFADMNLQGHNHAVNAHAAGVCKTGTHGIGPIYGAGAHCFLGGTAGTGSGGIISSSLTIKVEHKDVLAGTTGAMGTQCEGDNFHGLIEAETVWNGVPDVPSDGSWDITVNPGTKTNNQDAKTTTVKGTKALALA
jgi:hypothetical protein